MKAKYLPFLFMILFSCSKEIIPFKGIISVNEPSNFTHWVIGTSKIIKWSDNIPGNIKIDLYKANVFVQTIATVSEQDTVYNWKIPTNLKTTQTDYSIRISSDKQPDVFSESVKFTVETTVTDFDGNIYNTVTIGTQVWIRENLKVTHYNDGTPIPNITDNAQWGALKTGAYCWYNNDYENYGKTYGALYNGYTIDTKKLCPTGWHVPSDEEWTQLTDYVGGEYIAAAKLKEAGTLHWAATDKIIANESDFTGLAGGVRYNTSEFNEVRGTGWFWSSSLSEPGYAWLRQMSAWGTGTYRTGAPNGRGFSVRCIRDN